MFDMSCDKCGGTSIEWSEYEHKIWCYDCEIDTEGNKGIFDGPIPLRATYLLGLNFDRINLETEQLERLNLDTSGEKLVWDPPEVWEKNLDKKEKTKTLLRGKEPHDPYGEYLAREGSKYFKLVPAERDSESKEPQPVVDVTKA